MKEHIEAIREAAFLGDMDAVLAACDRLEAGAVRRRGRGARHPWEAVEIGGRFAMEGVTATSAAVMASRAGKRYGRRFMVQNEAGGIWILRVA